MKNLIQQHPDLSVPQLKAIAALANGLNFTGAAESAGVDRSTLYEWRHHDPIFRAALIDAKYEAASRELDRLNKLSAIALDKLEGVLTNPNTTPSVVLRASLAVLNRLKGTTEEGWATPNAIPEAQFRERERRHLVAMEKALASGDTEFPERPDTTKEILAGIKAMGEELANEASESPQNPPDSPNFSEFQPRQPIRVTKVGRNETCPCNSGLKYKKCCLNKPLAKAA